MTTRAAEIRALELAENHSDLVFEVAFETPCADCAVAENSAHKMLQTHRAWNIRQRLGVEYLEGLTEFFQVDTNTAIDIVKASVASVALPPRATPEPYWLESARSNGYSSIPIEPFAEFPAPTYGMSSYSSIEYISTPKVRWRVPRWVGRALARIWLLCRLLAIPAIIYLLWPAIRKQIQGPAAPIKVHSPVAIPHQYHLHHHPHHHTRVAQRRRHRNV